LHSRAQMADHIVLVSVAGNVDQFIDRPPALSANASMAIRGR
jgi:hypothetical protein